MSYQLVVRFVHQSREFTLGFECGRFWMMTEADPPPARIAGHFHTANEGELLSLARAAGYHRALWRVIPESPDWAEGAFDRCRTRTKAGPWHDDEHGESA